MSRSNQQLEQSARLAGLVGQIGCVTGFASVVIIAIAYIVGSFLDRTFGIEENYLTVLFLIGSFPVTLYVIVRISLATVARSQRAIEASQLKEEAEENKTEEDESI